MMRSAHAVLNNFLQSSKQTGFLHRVYSKPINHRPEFVAKQLRQWLINAGGCTTTPSGHTHRWATGHRRQKHGRPEHPGSMEMS